MGSLRVLLALAVVFAHSPYNDSFVFVGGENAVRLFYIASGYVISLVLAGNAYPSVRAFYLNRWLRLWPIYGVVCLLTLAFYVQQGNDFLSFFDGVPPAAYAAVVVTNITLLGQDWLHFAPGDLHRGQLVPQAWTLGVELSFYLLAPFILRKTSVLISLLVLSLGLRLALVSAGFDHDPWIYRFFPSELAWFLCGALSHRFLAPLYRKAFGPQSSVVATAALAVLICTFHLLDLPRLTGIALLVVLFTLAAPLLLEFQNRHGWDRRVGELSYPLYIGHYLVIQVVSPPLHAVGASPGELTAVVICASILFACGLNLLGVPVELLRQAIRRSAVEPSTATAREELQPRDAYRARTAPARSL